MSAGLGHMRWCDIPVPLRIGGSSPLSRPVCTRRSSYSSPQDPADMSRLVPTHFSRLFPLEGEWSGDGCAWTGSASHRYAPCITKMSFGPFHPSQFMLISPNRNPRGRSASHCHLSAPPLRYEASAECRNAAVRSALTFHCMLPVPSSPMFVHCTASGWYTSQALPIHCS